MKRFFYMMLILFITCGIAFAEVSGSTVDPSDIGVGARPLGMGKAYVGLADDACGMFVNPAGLAGAGSMKVTSMTGQVLRDVDYAVVGCAFPTDYGIFGLGFVNAGLLNIPLTRITGSSGTEEVVPIGATNYTSSVLLLSYSNELSKISAFSDYRDINYGVNFKYFMQGFNGGGAIMKDAGGTGVDMDLGLQYKPRSGLTLGLSAINILPEGMGGKFIWDRNGVEESIPALIKMGATTKIFGRDSFYGGNQNLYFGVDMDMYPTQMRPAVYHTGIEWWPISVMAVRLGVDQKPKGLEAGVGVENNMTAGIGLKYNGFTFDYCYHQFNDLSDNTTHFFSIGFVGPDEKPKVAEKPKPSIPVVVPKVSLIAFKDVPKDYWAKSPVEFMATLGVMNGFYDGKFRPDDTVTRAELASMLVRLKKLDVNEATSDPYPDVDKEYWAAKYIKAVSYMDLMKNYPDGTFKPEKKVTRVEAAVILSRFTDAPEPAELTKDPFVDVPRSHWAARYIAAAQNYGLEDYLIGKKFEPTKEVTRAEVAELLSKTSYGKDMIRDFLKSGI